MKQHLFVLAIFHFSGFYLWPFLYREGGTFNAVSEEAGVGAEIMTQYGIKGIRFRKGGRKSQPVVSNEEGLDAVTTGQPHRPLTTTNVPNQAPVFGGGKRE
jgi:hypothetical protein